MATATWREDRERLRQTAKARRVFGDEATLVYALISHMRGKLHMRWYQKYHGGWGPWERKQKPRDMGKAPMEIIAAYGHEYAQMYYARCSIETLDDQAAWIRHYAGRRAYKDKWEEVANRVLGGYVEDHAGSPGVMEAYSA